MAVLAAALRLGVPVLAICRGMQELNVQLGGTLHQKLQDLPGRMDHRGVGDVASRYGPAHPVEPVAGGLLEQLMRGTTVPPVNSLHEQAIDRLGDGVAVDAIAADGTIEAIRVPDARGFVLGVQWHPEWRWSENEMSRRIFARFGEAVRDFARKRKTS